MKQRMTENCSFEHFFELYSSDCLITFPTSRTQGKRESIPPAPGVIVFALVKAVFMSTLFGISDENLVLIIMSWVDLRDYGLLDLALTNVVDRKRWMICLSAARLNSNLGTIQCTHSLLRWLIKRKMQSKDISCNGSFAVIDDRSFVGIDNKFLQTLGLFRSDITDAGLLMIAQGCPQLKDIRLDDCKKISDEGLLALAVNLPGMTSIHLSLVSKVTCVGVLSIAERCPALVKLSLSESSGRSFNSEGLNDSIMAVALGCPNLQHISIVYSDGVSDDSLFFLADRCTELRSVHLLGCDLVTDVAIEAIANSCPDLEKLVITGVWATGENGLSFSSKITDLSFIAVGLKCSNLLHFYIAFNDVTDIGIAAIARGCPKLRSFYARVCPSISSASIMALSQGCKDLRSITLLDCRLITDESLFRIAEGCPDLLSFTLSSNISVSNTSLSSIAECCTKLTSITINDCSQIDDTTLIAIGSNCPNLSEISICSSGHNRQNFSDRGLITIACGCPALESITITDCPYITDVSIIVLAQKCFQLKSITLSSSRITDACLIAFATNSRKLQSVSFGYCHNITSTGLSVLAVECTQMRSMNFKTSKKVKKETLLSLRRKYLISNSTQNRASAHHRNTSALSMLRYFISCK
jgi:F-box and leucine-rich repeat protein 2/20